MFHIFLAVVTAMLLTGCLGAPKPQTHQKLAGYQSLQKSCEENPPQALQQECAQLITDLSEENRLLDEMQQIKDDTFDLIMVNSDIPELSALDIMVELQLIAHEIDRLHRIC